MGEGGREDECVYVCGVMAVGGERDGADAGGI